MKYTINKMLLRTLIFLLIFFIWPVITAATDGQKVDGRKIAQMVYDREDGKTSYSVIDMQLIDKRGKKKLRTFVSATKDYQKLTKTYTRFSSPAAIKGTVFLVWENADRDDDQFLYLPALKRVRRIVARQKKSRFVNSDFTYEDMQRKKPEESSQILLRIEKYEDRDCWVVESTPNKGTSQYQKWVSWVDMEYLLPLKVAYYSKKGKMIKRYRGWNIKKIGKIWTILNIEMKDLKKKHTTLLKIKKIQYNRNIKDHIFTKSYAKKGR